MGYLYSSGREDSLAFGALVATWLVFFVVLWLIFVVEPVVLPVWFYVPGVFFTLVFGLGLVASKRSDFVWQHTFDSMIRIPRWVWISSTATASTVLFISIAYPLVLEHVLWLGIFIGGIAYLSVVASRKSYFRQAIPWPLWIVITSVLALGVVVGLSIAVGPNAILSLIFFFALILFSFHVWVILPLTFYQSRIERDDWRPSTYPSVSVLIPAYNEEGYVGDCIESVLDSTYPSAKTEIVVIDDGSTDGTLEEASAYREQGVRVFHRDNGGKHAALNFALQCSTGDVVVTIDADSRPEPTAIEKMVGQLVSDSSIGGLSATVLAENDRTVIEGLQRVEYAISNTNRRAYSLFGAVPVVPGCLGVYRREALEDVWGYDPDTITEDFDLTVKLLKNGWTVRHGTGLVWTIVPDGWKSLWRQRLRWYQGGFETLRKHKDVLRAPRHQFLHALSLPARLVSHLLGPIMSFVILFAVVLGFLTQPSVYLVSLVVLFFLLTGLTTLYSIIIEREPVREVAYAPLLFIGYKHFVDCTIGVGTVRAFLGDRRW